ncbi:MAG: hypothetical protein FWD04_00340 [Conexibacteraceae bacterium]|nr:hypothetical protein [Conexibacteraceae bacterium]
MRFRRPTGVAAAAVAIAVVVALSPAGATVGRFVDRALGVPHAARALSALPAPGRVLVSGPDGTWIVNADGAARHVGPWEHASWSPHGLFLAVTAGDELAAVSTRGSLQWMLTRPDVSDARWYSPSGFRVAYISGGELRVVAGNGTGDHLVASPVAHVAPAWRPGHPYQLAYVASDGRVILRDDASGADLWSANPRLRVHQLSWSADGRRLLALTRTAALLYAPDGRLLATRPAPGGGPITAGAVSPNGQHIAIVTAGSISAVTVYTADVARPTARRVLTGAKLGQAAWSPNGKWLLVSWPAADQWVFVHVNGQPQIAAVSRIAQQFTTFSRAHFPRLDGWCCTAPGAAG